LNLTSKSAEKWVEMGRDAVSDLQTECTLAAFFEHFEHPVSGESVNEGA
jgi:hypothetical protein